MRTPKWLFLVLAAMLCASLAAAQSNGRRTTHIGPESAVSGFTVAEQAELQRQLHDELSAEMPAGVGESTIWVEITQQDLDDLAAPHAQGREPLRIGVVKSLPQRVGKSFGKAFTQGVVQKNLDGSFAWGLTIDSPDAQALRFHLTGFSLPQDTAMYLLGENGQADGPYEGKGRNGDFWTRSITGEEGQILLLYRGGTPDIDLPKMSFVISEVAHIRGRPPRPEAQSGSWPCSDNAPCLVDASCVDTGPAVPAKDAVAKMEWIKGPFIYTCSGGLLADTDSSSQIPYFLTANHCINSSNNNLETFFNYTTNSCEGTCPDNLVNDGTQPSASTVGITLVATGSAGDFFLGTLNEPPPAGSTLLGWNNTSIADANGTDLYRISNANFGPQVYSQHDVDNDSPTCTGWPRGERIYSKDKTGATMGGSSGSPVVNADGEVVGQLSGCCGYDCQNECDSANNWTVDGALAYYWDSVAGFLDPTQSGGCTSDAECNDGDYCNGPETCVGGSCLSGIDPCPQEVCDETTDQCVSCGGNKTSCSINEDCCSGNCKNGRCRGN